VLKGGKFLVVAALNGCVVGLMKRKFFLELLDEQILC
jgi:hypothetical protein